MKKHTYLFFFIIVIVPTIMAQKKSAYKEGDKLMNENLNSILKKPVYESRVQEYSAQELLPSMKLSETDKSAVVDSLQKSGTLKIEKDTKGFVLHIGLKFPASYNSPYNTPSIFSFNTNILSRTLKLTLFESQLYNSTHQKLQITKSSFMYFGRSILPAKNGKNRKYKVDSNSISMSNPVRDSLKADSLCTGSATYKIKIITGYDSIRCTKKDISKIIKLNGAGFRIVKVIDNKVVLAILQNNEGLYESGVVSFDSIGKSFIHRAKFKDFLYARSDSVAHIGSFVISGELYDLIEKNPEMTLAENKKRMTDHPTSQKHQDYLILETDTPLTNDFLIYSPIYGFEKMLKLESGH